jgi:hypothetical protein
MVEFKRDNPGGEWLAKHRAHAEKEYDHNSAHSHRKGYNGKTTGYFTHTLKLPTKVVKDVPGAQNEHHYRDDHSSHKHRELDKSVKEHGFDTSKHPILIGVNHRGHPHVLEGNHRLAHAVKHGHEHIHAEVRYWNGGEDEKGHGFHPDQVLHYHHHGAGAVDKWREKHMKEDAATNNAGGGAIQGIGVGPKGEPGVYKGKHRGKNRKHKGVVMSDLLRRWLQGAKK